MENLVLVDNDLDITKIIEDTKQKSVKIISFDIQSHTYLDGLNVEHEKVEDYLDSNDQNMINSRVLDNVISWYNENKISHLVSYEDMNLGWLLENELPPFLLQKMKNFLGIIRILQKENPFLVIASTTLGLMVKSIDKNNKITIQMYEPKKNLPKELDRVSFPLSVGTKQFTLWIPKKLAIKCARFIEKITSRIFNFKFNPNDKKIKETILLLNINPNPYELFLLNISHLNKDIVLLYDEGSAVWNLRNLSIVRASGLKILQLSDLISSDLRSKITGHQKILEKNLEKILSENLLHEFFSIETYSFWPSIKQEFMSLCLQRFKEAIEKFELVKIMFSKMKIKSIVYLYNPNPSEKIISHIAKKYNVPGFALQHGYYILGNYTKKVLPILFPALQKSLKHLLWGKEMKDFLSKFDNLKGSKMILSGNPRYDQYFKIKNDCKNTGTILIASSFLQNYYEISRFDTYFSMLHQKMFREICLISKNIPGKKPIIKLHPGVKSSYDVKTIIDEIDSSIPVYKTQSIIDFMKNCDVLVTLDHSTVLLEAMILGKPTIIFAINPSWYDDDEMVKSGATIVVNTLEEFKSTLDKVLFDEKFRNELIQKGNKFVSEYLINQGNSSEFLAKVLDNY